MYTKFMHEHLAHLATEIRQDKPFTDNGHGAVIALLLTANRVLRHFDNTIGAAADLTQQQYNVLRILRGAGTAGLPTLEVAQRMIQQSPGMTRMMDRLEKKGLIRRQRSPSDRRQVLCYLTTEGSALLSQLEPCVAAFDKAMGGCLSPSQQQHLLEALQIMRAQVPTH